MRKERELKKIAKEIHEGQIFISTNQEEIYQCFPILYMAKEEDLPNDIGAVYEYYNKAMPRTVNSKPMFFSAGFLTATEAKKVIFYVKEIESLLEAFDLNEGEEDEEIEIPQEVMEEALKEMLTQLIEEGAITVVDQEEEKVEEKPKTKRKVKTTTKKAR